MWMRMTQFQLGTVRTSDRMVRRSNPASGYPLADDPHIAIQEGVSQTRDLHRTQQSLNEN